MKTLIVYMSSHGCTENTASELSQQLNGEVTIINLKIDSDPDPLMFDRVIIGGSIHAGQIQKKVKDFCIKNKETLLNKELGLFICCMYEGEVAQKQLMDAFPEEFHRNAKSAGVFGGGFDFEKMNLLEKLVVKKVAHIKESVSNIDHEAIQCFAKQMDKVFNPFLFLV